MANVPVQSDNDARAFLARRRQERQEARSNRGRLIFALDATASRQGLWAMACKIQSAMFQEVMALGTLDVQLVSYGGFDWKASPWVSDASALGKLMDETQCISGHTQIVRTFQHAQAENGIQKIRALVFVGDCFEESETDLYAAAKTLKAPAFLFQEGDFSDVTRVFKEAARLTGGAHYRFDPEAIEQLRDLLRGVATYVVGGRTALAASRNATGIKLLEQIGT